jgi:c-di-GMP-binding flagellar brake protein YcgR
MKNRRKSQRHRISLNGHLFVHGHRISVQIENLSRGGTRISLDKPLMEGDEVEISFSLLQKSAHSSTDLFRASGTVIWISEDMDAGFQAGVRFEPLTPQIKELLNSQLESYPPT